MRYLYILLLLVISSQSYSDTNLLFSETPHRLYMSDITACKDCTTYTIIVSDKEINKKISSAFKNIADSLGTKNAGAIIGWNDALKNYRFFKNNSCNTFTDLSPNVVIYIDTRENYCESFPYDNKGHLIAIISIISTNIDDLNNLKDKAWRLRIKQAISEYAAENKVVAATKPLSFKFVDYIGDKFKKVQEKSKQ